MKQTLIKLISTFVLLLNISSCKEVHDSIGDYLPLKVGQKYTYYYDGFYSIRANGEIYSKKGVCQWEFMNFTPGTLNVYKVKMNFNGTLIHMRFHNPDDIEFLDSTVINNEPSTINFEVNSGKVKITFPVIALGSADRIIDRYLNSTKLDTCIDSNLCLSLNVGIKYLEFESFHNNYYRTSYTLKEGPY